MEKGKAIKTKMGKVIRKLWQNKMVSYVIFCTMVVAMTILGVTCLFFRTKEINISNLSEDVVIDDSGYYVITGASDERVINVIAGNPTITLKDVHIDVREKENLAALKIGNSTSAKIILEGENILRSGRFCAGIQTQETSNLEIAKESTGSVIAEGGYYGAGIGSGASTESLNTYAPGIGTGQYFGIITLRGGEIEAIAGEKNYSIGGEESENNKIVINGAKLTENTINHIPPAYKE